MELAERWEGTQAVQGARLDALRLDFLEALRRGEGPGAGAEQRAESRIAPELRVLFDRVLQRLDEVGDADSASRALLELSAESAGAVPFQAARAMRSELVYSSIGVAVLLRSLVEQLRAKVARWATNPAAGVGPTQTAGAVARHSAIDLCDAFDAIWRMMPMGRLDEFTEFASMFAGRARAQRYGLRVEVQDSLEELSRAIREWAARLP